MGEIADSTINGDFCDICGEWLGVGKGHPRRCTDCAEDFEEDDRRGDDSWHDEWERDNFGDN